MRDYGKLTLHVTKSMDAPPVTHYSCELNGGGRLDIYPEDPPESWRVHVYDEKRRHVASFDMQPPVRFTLLPYHAFMRIAILPAIESRLALVSECYGKMTRNLADRYQANSGWIRWYVMPDEEDTLTYHAYIQDPLNRYETCKLTVYRHVRRDKDQPYRFNAYLDDASGHELASSYFHIDPAEAKPTVATIQARALSSIIKSMRRMQTLADIFA